MTNVASKEYTKLEIRFPKGIKIKVAGFACLCRMPATKFSSWTFIEFHRCHSRPSVVKVPLFAKETRLLYIEISAQRFPRSILQDILYTCLHVYTRSITYTNVWIFRVRGTRNGDMMF